MNFGFENNTNEDKSQSIFYEDEWCENNCNDNYKDCWLKYFKKLQELEKGSDSKKKKKNKWIARRNDYMEKRYNFGNY